MQRPDNVRPVIIKRKKVVGGSGHHGGAWKVAYADFVTAMMAFFLMLWLLGSADEAKRKGIADYFSATYAIRSESSGGSDLFGGTSLSVETSLTDEIAARERTAPENLSLQRVVDLLDMLVQSEQSHEGILEHILIRLTDEGLIVEVFDLESASLFDGLSDQPTLVLNVILELVSEAFQTVSNPVAIRAHTRGFPTVFLDNPVWPLSIDRARAVHQMMGDFGLPDVQFHRISGNADRLLAVPNPTAARNNRVELILMRDSDRP